MKLKLDRKNIVDKFLIPISRISEECGIHITTDNIYALVNDISGNTILYCKLNTKSDIEQDLILNIKDVRKLCKVFDCIDTATIELELDDNASVLKYKSPNVSFKLHLVTENVIRKCNVSLEKINKLTYNSTFVLTGDKLNEILKGSIFSTDTNKLYFYTQDNKIYAELTDKATADMDSITFIVTETQEGDAISTPLPLSMEVLRLLASSRPSDIIVKINNKYGLLTFTITTDDGEMTYIIPAFTK